MGIGKFNIMPEGPLSPLVFNLIVYSIFGLEALVVSAIHALYLSKNILHSRYKIHKTKSNIKNIIFMFICLLIAIIINSILFSGADNKHLIFQLLVFYIVQSVAYYLLLKVRWFKTQSLTNIHSQVMFVQMTLIPLLPALRYLTELTAIFCSKYNVKTTGSF